MKLKSVLLMILFAVTMYAAEEKAPSFDPQEILKEQAVEEAQESNFYKEFVNMLITLGFLLAILFAISFILRRMNLAKVTYANESSAIKILDQRALSPRSAVFVLQYKGKEYFVGETQSGITILSQEEGEISPPPKKFM